MQQTTKQNHRLRGVGLALFMLPFLLFTQTAASVQTCNASVSAITPSSDFALHNDGTVTHNTTGLMWKVCSEGQTWDAGSCTGTTTVHTWDAALQIPQSLNSGGGYPISPNYTDWRLPNVQELKSIAELKCAFPAINETVFPSIPSSQYWSSSPNALNNDKAWGVYFNYGYVSFYSRNLGYRVRLVRSGQ